MSDINLDSCCINKKTPYETKLSAIYKQSFAYYTVKERMPVILTRIIDNLVRDKDNICINYNEQARDELKTLIGEISKLKYEIQTNKALIKLTSDFPDSELWNTYLDEQSQSDPPTFFNSVWLYAECYMYRRLKDMFYETATLKNFDPFKKQKDDALITAVPLLLSLTDLLNAIFEKNSNDQTENKNDFIKLLKTNLWGNKFDLSLSQGAAVEMGSSTFEKLNENLLVDQSDLIWDAIQSQLTNDQISVVTDNAGYEIFSDFCLADFLITKTLTKTVQFHVKQIPWFISDVITEDFERIMKQLSDHENEKLRKLGERWSGYVKNHIWTVESDLFWTSPFEFSLMQQKDSALYEKLSKSKLIIFKGDLNYRKLLGEINWEPTTSFAKALQGFHPTNLCTLRTLKADLICGLNSGTAEHLNLADPDWLISGNYGVIQYCPSI